MAPSAWHILTGEYPPRTGGIGDYTAQVAAGLAATGVEVHVWTTAGGSAPASEGVIVHRDVVSWSRTSLKRLGAALDAFPAPRRLLVQYTPNAWGYRGLNLGFGRWLLGRRRRGDIVRVIFHEVAYPWEPRGKPTRWILAGVQRIMARTLMRASTDVGVTIPAWEATLRAVAPDVRRDVRWRPVPSNIPVVDDAEGVHALRRRFAPGGEAVVGSFSSFSALTGPLLAAALPRVLLAAPDRVGLLIGQGGDAMAARLVAAHPALRDRLVATGPLGPADVSRYIRACDLMIQTYPDGVTTRRTSVMAALVHGIAVVTNAGRLTEPLWAESGAVELASTGRADDLARAAERLLTDPAARDRVRAAGLALYDRRFALARLVEALAAEPAGAPS
jgi:glycosyltransferase involved in cell wall biosynthesis